MAKKQKELFEPKLVSPIAGLSMECFRLFNFHRSFHDDGTPACVICRSLRRSMLRGAK